MTFAAVKTKDQSANAIAAYLPNDPTFAAKFRPGSNLRRLLLGLGLELLRVEGYADSILSQRNPATTSIFLSEWEVALGLPFPCLSGGRPSAEIRRAFILAALAYRIQTEDDYQKLLTLFGVSGKVGPFGGDASGFPFDLPIILSSRTKEARFTMVLTINRAPPAGIGRFPFTLPMVLGQNAIPENEQAVICLINNLKPANVRLFIEYR